jgi:hypothetical protein
MIYIIHICFKTTGQQLHHNLGETCATNVTSSTPSFPKNDELPQLSPLNSSTYDMKFIKNNHYKKPT